MKKQKSGKNQIKKRNTTKFYSEKMKTKCKHTVKIHPSTRSEKAAVSLFLKAEYDGQKKGMVVTVS